MVRRVLPGVVTALFGLFVLYIAIPFWIEAPRMLQPGAVGPDDFPRYLSWALVVTGAALCVISLGDDEPVDGPREDLSLRNAVGFAAVMLSFLALISIIGMVPSIFLFVLIMLWSTSVYPVWKGALIALVVAVMVEVVFAEIAGIRLPRGVFGNL